MKACLVICLVLYPFPASAMSYSEIKQKIADWHPGEEISCEFVRGAYKLLGKRITYSIAKKKGATDEQIQQKLTECGLP